MATDRDLVAAAAAAGFRMGDLGLSGRCWYCHADSLDRCSRGMVATLDCGHIYHRACVTSGLRENYDPRQMAEPIYRCVAPNCPSPRSKKSRVGWVFNNVRLNEDEPSNWEESYRGYLRDGLTTCQQFEQEIATVEERVEKNRDELDGEMESLELARKKVADAMCSISRSVNKYVIQRRWDEIESSIVTSTIEAVFDWRDPVMGVMMIVIIALVLIIFMFFM